MRTVMNARVLLALGLLGLTASFGAGCRGGTSPNPPIHLQPNMDAQARVDAQEPSDLFEDGRGARAYVEGTVPAMRVSGEALPCVLPSANPHLCSGQVDGDFADELPMPITLALLQRGQQRYDIYCQPCHDAAGTGNGSVVERGMLKPPTFHDDRLRKMRVGQFYDIVANGVRNMPGYGKQLTVEDRWAVAAYIRALQLSQNASLDDIPGSVAKSKGWK